MHVPLKPAVLATIGLLFLFVSTASAEREERDGVVLLRGAVYTPERAAEVLDGYAAQHRDRASWEARRALIRRGIIEGAGLDGMPTDREPPAVIVHSTHEMDGYTIHNAAIETVPGYWLGGNLYLPAGFDPEADAVAKLPGVLCPHGHWPNGRLAAFMQTRCGAIARMGCAVFAYDMVGHADTNQVPHDHPQTLRLQTFNGVRALDYLESLAYIDQDRLAVTGCSGGGTQTFILSAIDDRVDLSMPVCQVSAHFFGGCVCESGMPVHADAHHETNNVEIAACFAPKPLLMVSNGKDWTANTPAVEFPYVQRVFAYYAADGNVENAHFADEGHDYGPSKRAAAYRFIARHFGLDLSAVQNDAGEIDESWFAEVPADELRVFTDEHPRPAEAIKDADAVFQRLDAWMRGSR